MRPIVSIITPTFNHEKYIAESIESVLNQTVKDWEMIIIDDGSTDSTPDIIRRYDDPRITYVRKEHRGIDFLRENYNYALEVSKGDFILILEGDDYIPANRIEVQLPVFEDKEIVLSHGKYAYVYNNKIVVYPPLFKSDVLNNEPIGSAFKVFLHGFNPIGTQGIMIRKSALLEIGGFIQPPYLPLVDYPTWMRLALKGRFVFIPQVLGFWRRHPLSITMNKSEQIFNGFIRYCDEFITSFREELTTLGLIKFIENRGAIAYLSLGLIRLSNKDWEKALKLIKEGWRRREAVNGPFRIRILVAMIGAYLHLDIPNFLIKIRELLYRK